MLSADEKRLRWLGVDMHSRLRRRWTVIATYVGFYAAMNWCLRGHGWLSPTVGLWATSILMLFCSVLRDNGLVKAFGAALTPGSDVYHAMLDERELAERNKAADFTLGVVAGLLATYSFSPLPMSKAYMTKTFLTVMVLALTLPKAFALWKEPDPRELEELRVVDRGA